MARPRNDEMRELITRTTRQLFRVYGYAKTSYSMIAEECGITKALVQHHFPKKELLALAFMESLLEKSIEALDLEPHAEASPQTFTDLYRIGQVYFSFLLQEDWRVFLFDTLKSRELTEEVLSFNTVWALEFIRRDNAVNEELEDSVVVSMGGYYELLYRYLKHGRTFDVTHNLYRVNTNLMDILGYDEKLTKKMIDLGRLNHKQLEAYVRMLDSALS